MFKFIIKGNPLSSKNTRPIYIDKSTGKRFIGKSKRLKEYTKDALIQLGLQKRQYFKNNVRSYSSVEIPIYIDISTALLFYVKDRRKRDLANLIQLPADLLQQAEIIKDDSQIKSFDGSRIYIDKANPRTEIYISAF